MFGYQLGLMAAAVAVGSIVSATQPTPSNALRNPPALKEAAPETFRANFDTSAGSFVITVHRDWAPNGADRFYNLVKHGFYDDARFFRAVSGFMVQFGLHANPVITALWREARIPPDKVTESNRRGLVTFAMGASPDTRTTQVFINLVNNARLDAMGLRRSAKSPAAWTSWTKSTRDMAMARRVGKARCRDAFRLRAMRI